MKNANFTKLLAILFAMALSLGGFFLLPGPDDLRNQVYDVPVAKFMDGFFYVEKSPDIQDLPQAVIRSSENREVELDKIMQDRVTIINFWASWCAPCLEELPSLAKFQSANPDILIMPISLDGQKKISELSPIFDSAELKALRWFHDESGVLRKSQNLQVYPTTYVLDKQGKIIYILQGPNDWGSHEAAMFGKFLLSKS